MCAGSVVACGGQHAGGDSTYCTRPWRPGEVLQVVTRTIERSRNTAGKDFSLLRATPCDRLLAGVTSMRRSSRESVSVVPLPKVSQRAQRQKLGQDGGEAAAPRRGP